MNCDIIRDLIPLYSEGLCSAESAAEVERHVKTCEGCAKLLKAPPESVRSVKSLSPGGEEKPFRRVKRRLALRAGVIALLALALAAVVLPLMFLTYCQIFRPDMEEGGVCFDTIFLQCEAKPIAELIADGNAREYADSISYSAMTGGLAFGGDQREIFAEKLAEKYEAVKPYSPKVGKVTARYFDTEITVRAELLFTVNGVETARELYLAKARDGRFVVGSMPDLNYEQRSAAIGDDRAARAIADYLNIVCIANGAADFEAVFCEEMLNRGSDPSAVAEAVSKRFAPEDREAVRNGITNFFAKGYTPEAAFSSMRYDGERDMFYYSVSLTGFDGDKAAVVTQRIYLDERGFHSPDADGIIGSPASSENTELYGALITLLG